MSESPERQRARLLQEISRAEETDRQGQPGITLSRDQIESWVGQELTDEQIVEIGECIPNSSIPDAVNTIAHVALGISYFEDEFPEEDL